MAWPACGGGAKSVVLHKFAGPKAVCFGPCLFSQLAWKPQVRITKATILYLGFGRTSGINSSIP